MTPRSLIDEMRSRVIDTETEIQKLKSQSGLIDIGGAANTNLSQQQTADQHAADDVEPDFAAHPGALS